MPRLILTTLLLCLAWVPAARAQDDPALEQRIDAHQRVTGGRAELARGHVDVGPRFADGRWTLMIHDDTRKAAGAASVWRHAERTVLRVSDAGRLTVPDDPVYAFLHTKPGAPVHVVPETQDRDVVWVGWNTQDPEVMRRIDRGVTLTLTGVQGPGDLVVYLQSGSFSEPKVLWDSTGKPAPVWVDVNTHTHANWVFTEPGVYLVRITVAADLRDGSKVADTRELRFAVGDAATADEALATAWRAGTAARPVAAPAAETAGGAIVALIAVAAVALAGGAGWAAARGARAKRAARAARPRAVEDGDRA